MDRKLANQYAARVLQGEGAESFQTLVSMCIGYSLYVRRRFGFWDIPVDEVKNELVADAVTDAIMFKGKRNIPFDICLQNTLRDNYRKRRYIVREHFAEDISTIFDDLHPSQRMGEHTSHQSPEEEAQQGEFIELLNDVFENHEPFSKKVVYQRMRGSTYPELEEFFCTPRKECKRVFWHDFYHLEKAAEFWKRRGMV